MAGPIPIGVINLQGVSNVVNATESALLASPVCLQANRRADTLRLLDPTEHTSRQALQPTPGDTILLYGTGFGSTTPAQPAGQLVNPSPLANPVTLQITGLNATTTFAGWLAPASTNLTL